MPDPHAHALATFWARDARLLASLYRPEDDQAAWRMYLDGLEQTYQSWGIDRIIDRPRLERDGATLFWLLRDRHGAVEGGVRVEGPFADVGQYAGVGEMATSPGLDRLEDLLGHVGGRGLVEFKGSWSRGRGRGAVLARCFQHSLWWLEVPHAFCVCASHAQAAWETTGGRRIEDVDPAVYPDGRYRSVALLWGRDHVEQVTPDQSALIAGERRYLAPAWSRIVGGPDVSSWHPELIVGGERRAEELVECGARKIDQRAGCDRELDGLLPPIGQELRDEPSHWVHYPWRNELVHLLGPASHWRLRTDRNRYKLDDVELGTLRGKTIGVVGLSVGSAVAYILAQEGLCGRLRLADHDAVELTNLNRLSGSVAELGLAKTHLVARRIAELDPFLAVELYEAGLDSANIAQFMAGLDAVVEECDSIDIKLLVRHHAAELGIPVIMETSDRGLLDVERFDLEPSRRPFHGLVVDLDPANLAGLTTEDKVPYVLSILEPDELSAAMAASMVEIDATTRTWPQLASDVSLGSALVAAATRKLFLDAASLGSGRLRVDLSELLDDIDEPAELTSPIEPAAATHHPPLPAAFDSAVLTAAALAPSGGNMQPWRFELTETAFEVFVLPRTEVGMDIGLRGSAVACGAALANALVVVAAHGRVGDPTKAIDTTIDLSRPDLVGSIPLGSASLPEWAELAPFVPLRSSNRQLGPRDRLADAEVASLEQAVRQAGGSLRYLPPEQVDRIVDYWAESDRVRYLTPRLHREMMSELRRPGLDPLADGLDERTLELSDSDRAKLPILRRSDVMANLARWDGGARLGDDTRKRLTASSGLLIVATNGSTRPDYVTGGVALQRMWLVATKLGLQLQPQSPIFGYASTIDELADVVGPTRARTLHEMGQKAYEVAGLDSEETFVLACRVHRGPAPTAVSRRRSASWRATGEIVTPATEPQV